MLNKKEIIKKVNSCSGNDLAIIETFLAIFDKGVYYNEQGVAVDIIDLV